MGTNKIKMQGNARNLPEHAAAREDWGRRKTAWPQEFPVVSVVVPTRNRQVDLLALLRSIDQSDYERIEITVVDDFSSKPFRLNSTNLDRPLRVLRKPRRLGLSASLGSG